MNSDLLPPVALTPQQLQESVRSFEDSRFAQKHAASLASPILIANEDLCEERTVYSLGIGWVTINDLPIEHRRDVGPALGLGEIPSILYVETGSAAEKAGLRRGDLLLAVNDVSIKSDPLQTGQDSNGRKVRPYRRYLTEIIARTNRERTPVRLSLRREGINDVVEFRPQERCNVQVSVVEDTGLALYSRGGTIYLSRGLYEFAQSDEELQALIAHELGHFIAGHGTKSATGSVVGGVVGGLVALGAISTIAIADTVNSIFEGEPDTGGEITKASAVLLTGGVAAGIGIGSWISTSGQEKEADYLSTYLLARAGVDIEDALLVWNRLPTESEIAKKHRTSNERLQNINNSIEEVSAKRDSNERLIPNSNRKVSKSKRQN